MYTVDRIEDNIVILEDRSTLKKLEIEKNKLPKNIKEKDIISLKNNKYIIKTKETKKIKQDIKNRFNKLKE